MTLQGPYSAPGIESLAQRKGKVTERWRRKATGSTAEPIGHDSQLPKQKAVIVGFGPWIRNLSKRLRVFSLRAITGVRGMVTQTRLMHQKWFDVVPTVLGQTVGTPPSSLPL